MGTEGICIVSGRSLYEPDVPGLAEQSALNLTALILAIIDRKRFFDRTISENDQSVGAGIVYFVGVVINGNNIYRIRNKVITVLMTAATEFSIKPCCSQLFYAHKYAHKFPANSNCLLVCNHSQFPFTFWSQSWYILWQLFH